MHSEPAISPSALPIMAGLLMLDSLHFVFARLLLGYISPGVSAFYVLGIAAVEVGIIAWWRGGLRWRLTRQELGFFLAIGFLIGASTNINFEAIALIDPGTAAMLGKTGVIFSLGLGVFWLGERLNRMQMGGALLALLGVALISYHPGELFQLGSLLVLSAAFMYALHTALVKRQGQMEFFTFFFHRLLFTTVFLFLFSLSRGALALPSAPAWGMLILVGTVDVVLSRGLYYLALNRLKLTIHTIILTVSPVAAIIWSLFLFRTFPSPQELLGGGAVLIGVLVVTLQSARRP